MNRDHTVSIEEHHDLNMLAAFADGRLGQEERVRVIRHFAECFECRQLLATLSRAMTADASTSGRSERASLLSRRAVWLALAATLVIATGSALYLVGPMRATPP